MASDGIHEIAVTDDSKRVTATVHLRGLLVDGLRRADDDTDRQSSNVASGPTPRGDAIRRRATGGPSGSPGRTDRDTGRTTGAPRRGPSTGDRARRRRR